MHLEDYGTWITVAGCGYKYPCDITVKETLFEGQGRIQLQINGEAVAWVVGYKDPLESEAGRIRIVADQGFSQKKVEFPIKTGDENIGEMLMQAYQEAEEETRRSLEVYQSVKEGFWN